MQKNNLNKLFDSAKDQDDLISKDDVVKIVSNTGQYVPKSGNVKMYTISSLVIVASIAASYFGGLFDSSEVLEPNQIAMAEKKLEEDPTLDITAEDKLNKQINSNNEDPVLTDNKIAMVSALPPEDKTIKTENGKDLATKKKSTNTGKDDFLNPKPLKVEGLNPIILKPQELENIGITANDDESLDFYSLQKTSHPVKIHLTKHDHDMKFNVKPENPKPFSPVFVTDATGNKRISLYSNDKNGIVESFQSDDNHRIASRSNILTIDSTSNFSFTQSNKVSKDGSENQNFNFDFETKQMDTQLKALIMNNMDKTDLKVNGVVIEMDDELKEKVNKAGLNFFKTNDMQSAITKNLNKEEVNKILSQVGLVFEDLEDDNKQINISFNIDDKMMQDSLMPQMMKAFQNEGLSDLMRMVAPNTQYTQPVKYIDENGEVVVENNYTIKTDSNTDSDQINTDATEKFEKGKELYQKLMNGEITKEEFMEQVPKIESDFNFVSDGNMKVMVQNFDSDEDEDENISFSFVTEDGAGGLTKTEGIETATVAYDLKPDSNYLYKTVQYFVQDSVDIDSDEFEKDPMKYSKLKRVGYNLSDHANILNKSVEELVDINKLIPIAVQFDGKNTDYLLWFEPTKELITLLPTRYQNQLNIEFDAAEEVAVCGAPPEENPVMDVWRGCEGALKEMSLYPNPASDNITVEFMLEDLRAYNISISDMNGNIVKEFASEDIFKNSHITATVAQFNDRQHIELDINDLKSGMYYVVVTTDKGETAMQRMIVGK